MNIKLKCILLDDEIPGLQYLKLMCNQVPGLEIVKAFNDPAKCIAELNELDFDFCILDIDMPGISGLEVARLIRPKPVIFTTGYKEYAADAFDLDAVDYIRKPVQKDRFEKAIQKMAERFSVAGSGQGDFVRLNTNKGKALIYFDQVLLVTASETDPRDKNVLLENGQEITLKNIPFGQLLSLLPSKKFCRVNKRGVIALRAVGYFNYDEITTSIPGPDGQFLKLTLSEAYKADFAAKTAQ